MRRNFHVTTDRHVFWEQFYQVKGCSWTSGHTELRGQFTILRLWVGFAVWEVQNGNYFLPIKPHSPPRKTCTELTLQLVVTTSVTATVMKTPLIFTSYPDVMSMNLSKLDALLFLAVMWLMGVAQQKENGSYMKKCQRQHLWNFLSNHVMIAWTWHHWWIFQMYLFGV